MNNILLPGIIVGVTGFAIGRVIDARTQAISESLKPLEDALNDFKVMEEDYKNTYHNLQVYYLQYMEGADVNWDEVIYLEDQLKIKEANLDAQVALITSIIEEAEYGV